MKSSPRTRYACSVAAGLITILGATPPAKSQTASTVRVIGTSVNDDRDTQGSTLRIKLKVRSDAFAQAKDMRVIIKSAVDSTGRNLLRANALLDMYDGDFKALDVSDHNSTDIELRLETPARKAMTVSQITGELEIYTPQNDPSSVLSINNFQQQTGQPLVSSTMKAAGLTVTIWTKEQYEKTAASKSANASLSREFGEVLSQMFGTTSNRSNTIIFHVTDPNIRLVGVSFEDANGKRIKTNGGYSSGTTKELDYFYDFDKKLPPNTRVKLYVATPKSIINAPFQVKDLPLP